MNDPAFLSDRELMEEDALARKRERDIHDRVTKLRSEMSFTDMVDAINNVDETTMNEFLWAAREYHNHELGDLFSRQIQKYLRSVADMQMPEDEPIMLKNQCGG